MHIGTYPADRA